MLQRIQNFFLDLQQKDEMAKRRWLIFLTAISMLVVIVFWGFYLNLTIQNLNSADPSQKKENEVWATLTNGFRIILKNGALSWSKFLDNLQTLTHQTNSITIQGANLDFTVKNLEPITPKRFP